jgi:hypothetical protein
MRPTPKAPGRFKARLDGEIIVESSRQPLVDGARKLLEMGYPPTALLTMRHQAKAFASFQPKAIAEWAKWTYQEGEHRLLTRARWVPFADMRGTQKSGSDEAPAITLPADHQIASTESPAV